MRLREEFDYLLAEHDNCIWGSPSHICSCHMDPPCQNCTDCISYLEEAWTDED